MLGYDKRWRRAFACSVLVHACLMILSGFVAGRLFPLQANAEQIIELDLAINATPGAASLDGLSSPPSSADIYRPDLIAASPQTTSPQPSTSEQKKLRNTAAETPGHPSETAGGREASTGAGGAGPASADFPPGPAGNSAGVSGGQTGGTHAPGILTRVEPYYPDAARQDGAEGTVVLKVQILENGRPGNISIFRSSGDERLDKAAVAAISRWRFIPAKQPNGKPFVCYTTVPITFRLNN